MPAAPPVESTGPLKPGDVVGGKYRIEGVLGVGGMGTVHAARHLILRQPVAVKVLLPEAAALPEATGRFLREAQAAAAIQGEHVARVLDMGTLENGAPYLVMELLAGEDFGKMLKTRGPLPIPEAVDLILQAGEAIAEAHALGIIHRDLKPGNLFLTARPDGSPLVKVLDFGLSKASPPGGIGESSLTATSLVVGSSYYMAPEQFRGLRHADARTDLWALGVILFHLITGRRPFEGDSFGAVCAAVAADPPLLLREALPGAPPELEALLLRCMEKDKTRRVQTMAELAQALAPFGSETSPLSTRRITRLQNGAGRTAIASDLGSGPMSSRAWGAIPGSPPGSAPGLSTSIPGMLASGPGSTREVPPPSARSGLVATQLSPTPPSMLAPSLTTTPPDGGALPENSGAWGHTAVHPRRRGTLLLAGGAALLFAVIVGVSLTRVQGDSDGTGAAAQPSATANPPAAQPSATANPPAAQPSAAANPPAAQPSAAANPPAPRPSATANPPAPRNAAPSVLPGTARATSASASAAPSGSAAPSAAPRKSWPRTPPRQKPPGDVLDRWN